MSDNPPAFPTEWSVGLEPGEPMQTGEYKAQFPGMSLRDWFAGQALAGYWASDGADGLRHDFVARMAYSMANAMLAERERGR